MLKNSKLLAILLSIILMLIFSIGVFAFDYKYSQESGTGFFVGTADKADALEDINELRQIVNDFGTLLDHSKMDGTYPKDLTTGGTIQIPEAGLKFSNAPTNDDIAAYIAGEMTWQTKAELSIQPLDATLTALAGLTIGANELIYGTGADAFSMLGVNADATNKFLRQISSGVPAWATLVDGDIPNDITIDVATLATTFTVTDNESEALDCPIVFVDGATGAQGAETDGDLHYNPSTGLLTATGFVGDGEGLTGVGSTTATGLTIDAKEENTGAIVKGQPVYASGAAGVAKTLIGLADCDDPNKYHSIGIAGEAISLNGNGTVRVGGLVTGVDTLGANAVNPNGETWIANDILYLDDTAGGLTNVRPTVGHVVEIGHSLFGSSNTDAIVVHLSRPRIGIHVATGEDIIMRMGDSAGANKTIFKDYANVEVAYVDSDGNIDGTSLTVDTAIAATEGGTGKATITENSFLKGGAGNTYVERTYAEVKTDLAYSSDDLSDVASIAMLDEVETVTASWMFTNMSALLRESDVEPPYFEFMRKRDGDPTSNILISDKLGEIRFMGWHTGSWMKGATIRAVVDGTPGYEDIPTRLEFRTSPDNMEDAKLRMAIDSSGNIKMGDGAWTNYANVSAAGVLTFEGTASINEPLSILASTTSAQLATVISDETGTLKLVYSDSPVFTTKISTPQITFPASQSASANVNTLDDYEEGTWTPAIKFGGNSVDMTYVAQTGAYTKIGNRVFANAYIALSNKGTSVGIATIADLPFTSKDDLSAVSSAFIRLQDVSFADVFQSMLDKNTNYIYLQEITNAGTLTNLTEGNFANNSVLTLSISYITE